MPGALEGIRILDWTMFHHGSAAGYMLGDLGAEVIHIEHPVRGDAWRGMERMHGTVMTVGDLNILFETTNRNKKGITLDLTKDKGKEVLYRLVKKSDVFNTNFRKSVATKLGADYETLSQYNPKLIYSMATGYGFRGPEGEKRGYDPTGQARSGLMFQLGDRDQEEPLQPTGVIGDQAGATMVAYGILAALVARERLGIGQQIEASIMGSLIHLQAVNVNTVLWRGHPIARHSRARSRNPLSNMYQCGDGKWLILAEPQSDRFWHAFCEALGRGELEKDPRFENALVRRDNCEELISIFNGLFATRPRDEWLKILEPVGLACDPINTLADLSADPQVLENEYIVDFEHPVLGAVKMVGFPVYFSETPAAVKSRAPQFGEHTEEVLLELGGYTWEEIAQLRDEGVI